MNSFKIFSRDNKKKADYNIYVIGGESDVLKHQNRVNDILLAHSNIAIYYKEKEVDLDLYNDALSTFNLTVILISNSLFKNKKIIEEKNLLESHQVPILPLCADGSLDIDKYNKVFGEYHLIDIDDINKIKVFLDTLLVDSETIAKIKAAFDAYIFISYRKKDRKHAIDLINLLQSNTKYLSLGIWFDDYLTPGQNFNDEIFEYLDKSTLFSLVITPNLINEKNYVQSIEYPEAIKEHKQIIPFEYEKVDTKELDKLFPHIPTLVKPNKNNINSLIEKAYTSLSLKEDDNGEHLYFLSLAYLYGIDSLKNINHALKLLNRADELGFYLASKKLADIYHYGIGVDVNISKYHKYLKRYYSLYLNESINHGLEEPFYDVFLDIVTNHTTNNEKEIKEQLKIVASIYNSHRSDCVGFVFDFISKHPDYLQTNYFDERKSNIVTNAYHKYISLGGRTDIPSIPQSERTKEESICIIVIAIYELMKESQLLSDYDHAIEYLSDESNLFSMSIHKVNRIVGELLTFIEKDDPRYLKVLTLFASYLSHIGGQEEALKAIEYQISELKDKKKYTIDELIDTMKDCLNKNDLNTFFRLYQENLDEYVAINFADQEKLMLKSTLKKYEHFFYKYEELHLMLSTYVKNIKDKSISYTYIPYLQKYFDYKNLLLALKQDEKGCKNLPLEIIEYYKDLIEFYKNSNISLEHLYAYMSRQYYLKAKYEIGVDNNIDEAKKDYLSAIELLLSYENGYLVFIHEIMTLYISYLNLEYDDDIYNKATSLYLNGVELGSISGDDKNRYKKELDKCKKLAK